MIHKRHLQDRIKRILKVWVTPRLRELHFTMQGRVYIREIGRVQHLITTETDHLNTAEKYSFTLEGAVHLPGVLPVVWKRPEPAVSSVAGALIGFAPCFLVPPHLALWWELHAGDSPTHDDEIGAEMVSLVDRAALPFFAQFQSERDVAEFLERPRRKDEIHIFPYCYSQCVTYAGIIWDQLGEYEKCMECMRRAGELAKGKRLEADIEKFARDYVCGKLPRIA